MRKEGEEKMHRRKKRKARDKCQSCACVCMCVCVCVCVFSTLVAASREDLGEDGIQEEPG